MQTASCYQWYVNNRLVMVGKQQYVAVRSMVVVHTSYIVTTVCRIEVVVGMKLRKQESARRVRKKKIILIVKQFIIKIRTELEMYSFPPFQKIMRLRYAPYLPPSVSPGHRSSLQVRINSYDDYTYYVRIPVYRVNGEQRLGLPEHPVTVLRIHISMYATVPRGTDALPEHPRVRGIHRDDT